MHKRLANNKMGILLMVIAVFSYSCMDGVIRYLSQYYNVITLAMFRYCFFVIFIVFIFSRNGKSFIKLSKSKVKYLQVIRSIILTVELCSAHYCFYKIGLIQTSAIFAIGPLIGTALSVIILKEKVGWRRWLAIASGFIGILIILRPGLIAFEPFSFVALGCAFLFAIYQILTRLVSKYDNNDTTLFYTAVIGSLILLFIGPFFYSEVKKIDWFWIIIMSFLALIANICIINALKISEASLLQPFNYLHLVFVSIIGVFIFNEVLEIPVIIGSTVVISAGLYTFWRENKRLV